MGKKWVTFDLDGTLMQNPFRDWVFPAIERIAAEYVGDGKSIFCALVQEHRKRMDAGLIVEAYNWDDIVEKVFASKEISIKINVEQLVKLHANPPKVYLLEDGILETLLQLRRTGFHLAVVTNGYEKYQKPVMDVLGLTDLFDAIITPEKVGYGKPRIEMVDDLLVVGDKIVAHVGDRLDHDIVFANELGVNSILVDRDMTHEIKTEHPSVRINKQEYLNWIKRKWKKETGSAALPTIAIPKQIIYSLFEVSESLHI